MWRSVLILIAALILTSSPSCAENQGQHTHQNQHGAALAANPYKEAASTQQQAAKGCPGTDEPSLDCNAIQAHQAERAANLFVAELIVSACALLAASFAAGFAWSASRAAHEANRPWIEFSEHQRSPMHVSTAGADIKVEFHLFNRGKSPATHVVTITKLMAFSHETNILKCAAIAKADIERSLKPKRKQKKYGSTIFPTEQPAPETASDEIGETEITKARGNPPGQIDFVWAVGVRYKFGRRYGYTINVYSVLLLIGDIDFTEGHTTSVQPNQFQLIDCWNGYAR